MLRQSTGNRRSTLDSFEASMKQMNETQKLLENMENQLAGFINDTSANQEEKQNLGDFDEFEDVPEEKDEITSSKMYKYIDEDGQLQQTDYGSPGSFQNRDLNHLQAFSGIKQAKNDFSKNFTPYDNGVQDISDLHSENEQPSLNKQSFDHAQLSTGYFVKEKENVKRPTENSNKPRSNIQPEPQLKMNPESYYQQNKIQILDERVKSNEKEIFELRKANGDLRLEVARLKGELSQYAGDAKPQGIWDKFREEKESLSRGGFEGAPRSRPSHKDLSYQRDSHISGLLPSDKTHHSRQPNVSKNDFLEKIENSNHSQLYSANDQYTSNQTESSKLQMQDDEKLGFMFGLINKYKQEVELIKESNVLIQKQLKQEIHILKHDLQTQIDQNSTLGKLLKNERKQSISSNRRENNYQSHSNNLENMNREDLALYARSLQDSYFTLENKHTQQVKNNERLKDDLHKLSEKNKEDLLNFDGMYRQVIKKCIQALDFVFWSKKGGRFLQKLGMCEHPISEMKILWMGNPRDIQRVNQKETSSSSAIKPSAKKMRDSMKENDLPGRSPPVKQYRERKILRESKRDNSASPSTIEDPNTSYYLPPRLSKMELTDKDEVSVEKRKNRSANRSSERYDNFVEQLNRVRKAVQGKIAEKDVDLSMNQSMMEQNHNKSHTRCGLPLKDTRKSKPRSSSKGKTINMRS